MRSGGGSAGRTGPGAGRTALPWSIRQLGLALLCAYCFFNVANVLLLRAEFGFIGPSLVLMAGVYMLQRLMLFRARGGVLSTGEVLAALLLIFLLGSVMAQNIFLTTYVGVDGVDTLDFVITVTILSTIWMMMGGAASMFDARESSFAALAIGGALLAMFLTGVDLGEDAAVAYGDVRLESGMTGISHLTLEKFVVVPLALAYAMSRRTRFVVLLIGFVVLFLMSGRTAFAAFFLTAVLVNLRGQMVRNLLMLSLAAIVILLGARFAVESGLVNTESQAVREMLFLDGVEEDNSFQGRKELLRYGLGDLYQQFLFGDFTLSTRRVNAFGGYIHNLLSAWQVYGFFVFAAICVCLLYCANRARLAFRESASTPRVVFGVFMLVYVLINVIIAKSVFWNLLWFMLGYWLLMPLSGNLARRRKKRRSESLRSFLSTP